MHLDKYAAFEVEDFVDDEDFRSHVLSPDLSNQHFWKSFANKYPGQSRKVESARQLVISMRHQQSLKILATDLDQAHASLARLKDVIKVADSANKRLKRRRILFSVAATISLLLGATFFYTTWWPKKKVFKTANGERMTVNLSDGSTVFLNASSTLYLYPKHWSPAGERVVYLDGEAFFDVKKSKESHFVVRTDDLEVVVLGTQFNVRTRNQHSEVVLAEGQIELEIKEAHPEEQHVLLEPGDFVRFEPSEKKLDRKKVQPAAFSAWKDGFVVFNNINLSDACRELEMIFGIKFYIQNPDLGSRVIQLSIPGDDLDAVLNTLKGLYPDEIHVKREMHDIIIF